MNLAVSIDSIAYNDNIEYGTYDITGRINGGTKIRTTYRYEGYRVFFKVGNNEKNISNYTSGSIITNNGVQLKITGTPSSDNKAINVVYNVNNTTDQEQQYAIATTADIDLVENDYASIYKNETSIVQVTQDNQEMNSSYGTQFKISFTPVANTTWLGFYEERYNNRYVNGSVLSYTYDDYIDTGLAFSWNGTLAAGEETSYTATFAIKDAEMSTVSFYKMNEQEPFEVLNGLVGGSIITPSAPNQLETGYEFYWNTKPDGTGKNYEAEKGIIISSGNMKLYEYNKSLWHDSNITLSDGINVADDDEFGILELLVERGLLVLEENQEDNYQYVYNKNGKLLFKVDNEGIVTLEKGLTYKDNITYILTKEEKEHFAQDEIYIDKIILSFDESSEISEYEILEGANQKHIIGDGKNLVVKANGDLSKLIELRVDDKAIDEENYELESGSTIATLKTAYLDTLSEGEHTLTFVYEDGDVSTNFTIANKTNNPKTGDIGITVWICLMIVSVAGITGTSIIKKINKNK